MSDGEYKTNVVTGNALTAMTSTVRKFERRDCYEKLITFLNAESNDRICIIYGLRRTGKTTMLRQAITDLPISECAYIKAQVTDTMSDINCDLKQLYANGFKYVFVDEVTLLKDFIDSASLLSDVFAAQGMKIILSGTDSLGFWLALDQELYDRAETVHTTFIPFREHSRLLKINDLDEYIRYGGTLRAGELNFDDKELLTTDASFRDDESTRRYIDTAICRNIQNSLAFFENGGHFRHLYELYQANELTSAVNRIIEDINHKFLLKVLEDNFKSHDLGLSAANLRKERNEELRTDILDRIDSKTVTSRLMDILDIRNREDRTVGITNTHIEEIKEYLRALDLIVDCPIETVTADAEPIEHILFTQPGMRFCQAQALVHSLMKDKIFSQSSEYEKNLAVNRILDEVKGRMTEDIILLETMKMLDKQFKVFKLQFARGEFDMVIYNRKENTCAIYEIKHSSQTANEQYRHLIDEEKCAITERRFGKITKRTVLYNGESFTADNGVEYENISEYLSYKPLQTMTFEPKEQPNTEMKFGF